MLITTQNILETFGNNTAYVATGNTKKEGPHGSRGNYAYRRQEKKDASWTQPSQPLSFTFKGFCTV